MILPTKQEKIEQFKEIVLEGVEVEEEIQNLVKIKGGYIDFTHLGGCYVRTAKLVLYELSARIGTKTKVTQEELITEIHDILEQIEGLKTN